MQALDRAILAARMDESVQVIVITGNGEKFFSAGADLKSFAGDKVLARHFIARLRADTLRSAASPA